MKDKKGIGKIFSMGTGGRTTISPPRMEPDAISLHGYTPVNLGEFRVGRVPTAHCRPEMVPDLDDWMNKRTTRDNERLRRLGRG